MGENFIRLGANLDDVPEEQPPSEGLHKLTVVSKEVGRNKDDTRDQIRVAVRCDDEPDTSLIFNYLTFPNEDDFRAAEEGEEKAKQRVTLMLRSTKRFLHCFGIEWDAEGFDPDELDGAQGECRVYMRPNEEDPDGEGFPTLRLPRIPGE